MSTDLFGKSHLKRAVLIAGFLAFSAARLQAQDSLYSSIDTNPLLRTGDGFSLGGVFTVGGSNVTVTALGVYDATGNGLTLVTPIGIWMGNGFTSGGTDPLLVSATVPTGTSAALFDSFRYVTLGTPVTLLAGDTYTIAAYYSSTDTDQLINEESNSTVNSDFTVNSADYSSSNTLGVLSEPSGGGGAGPPYIGPNIEFVPEPSSIFARFNGVGCSGSLAP